MDRKKWGCVRKRELAFQKMIIGNAPRYCTDVTYRDAIFRRPKNSRFVEMSPICEFRHRFFFQ